MYVNSTATKRMLVIIIFQGVSSTMININKTRPKHKPNDLLTFNVHKVNRLGT